MEIDNLNEATTIFVDLFNTVLTKLYHFYQWNIPSYGFCMSLIIIPSSHLYSIEVNVPVCPDTAWNEPVSIAVLGWHHWTLGRLKGTIFYFYHTSIGTDYELLLRTQATSEWAGDSPVYLHLLKGTDEFLLLWRCVYMFVLKLWTYTHNCDDLSPLVLSVHIILW